jgi:WD40 repeat protein/serine/threonine protein kinase
MARKNPISLGPVGAAYELAHHKSAVFRGSAMKDRLGQTIQGYELLERIGAGGFGAVYRALQSTVGREVAVKAILPAYANDPGFIRRFEIEAQLIARLEHLHIVPLYDFWRDPEGAYIVMRWLRGGSLSVALEGGPFDLEPAGLLLDQVAAGLAAAHDQQIIHRDLKPSNILLDEEGNAYLADFGIAMDLRDGNKRSKEGEIAGSLKYLSPEQLRGQEATAQSDIYSLGITLYETLTGRHPFPARTSVQQLFQHIDDPLPRIEDLDPAISDAVSDVIQKATAKNPANRYPDALALAAAFRQAAQLGQDGQTEELVESLTLREQEILRLIVEGSSNKEIAQTLYVELPTVKWHITKIYKKLGVRSRVQAIVRAREMNLIVFTDEHEIETTGATRTSIVLPEPVNPYKGLMAFEPADNRHFFGREALVETLLSRLVTPTGPTPSKKDENGKGRFLAIVGPSGSGKSSLVKAGLIPALWSGELPGSDKWFIVDMAPGAWPLDELEIALTRIAANQAVNLRQHLDRDGRGLSRTAALILPNDDSELLLVVDQFEELFTLVEDESVREHFLALLHGAVTDPRSRVRVIITLRADFYDRPLQYQAFGQLLRGHMETLLPLTAEELERAIVNPAELTGVTFEPGLVATIIEDVNYRPGALPLLQYALTELFERRRGRVLTSEAYAAIGGAAGALAGRAEELYQEQDEAGCESIHQMFLRLVTAGSPAGDVGARVVADNATSVDIRQRVLRSELLSAAADPDSLDEIVDTFAAYRLLSLDYHPVTRQPTVEVAHEAILREWDRLRGWLEESQADLALHRQLIRATAEWQEAGGDWSFLLRGSRLTQFEAWAAGSRIVLTDQERAYLEASLANRQEREAVELQRQEHEARLEQSASRRLKALVAVLSVALVIAVGLIIAAVSFARQAQTQQRLAGARELAAAALVNLDSSPERSVLLALEAAQTAQAEDGSVRLEVEEILHRAVQADRTRLSIPLRGALAFSPDGRKLAIGDDIGRLELWDTVTGENIRSLDGHLAFITSVMFSPDGDYLVTSSFDTQVKVWPVDGDLPSLRLGGYDGSILDVGFGANGRLLVTAGEDGKVRTWDISSLTTRQSEHNALVQLKEPALVLDAPGVTGVTFSPDNQRIASVIPGKSNIIWDANSGERLLEISDAGEFTERITFSPDSRFLAGGSSSTGITVWDAETGEVAFVLADTAPVYEVAFSQDGQYLASASPNGTATVWEVGTRRQIFRLSGLSRFVRFIAISPDGGLLATATDDETTRVWDLTPAGSSEVLAIAAHDGEVYDAIYSPQGTEIASTGEDGALKVWDVATGQLFHNLPGQKSGVFFPAYSGDGTRLAAANRENGVSIWDLSSGKELLSLKGDMADAGIESGPITAVAFSPDGTRLVAADQEGTVAIWDAASGELLTSFHHPAAIMRLVYHPDGKQIWAFDRDGGLSYWGANTGEFHGRTSVSWASIWDADFSPNGRYWAAAAFDGRAYVFEAQYEPGQQPGYIREYILRRHSGNVTGVAFNPEGAILATSAFDGQIKLWDMADGAELLTLTDRNSPLSGVDFSPDGRHVVSAGSDGTINVYVVEVEELMDLARSRLSRDFTRDECQRFLHLPACPDE